MNAVGCQAPPLSVDTASCNAEPRCYWDAITASCALRSAFSSNLTLGASLEVPWCYRTFSLPFLMSVYGLATLAFGFCLVGAGYLFRYYDVHSRLEDTGQRVFNVYYFKSSPIIIYCVAIVATSGILAVTAYINLNVPANCVYVYFVYIYLVVQLAPCVIYPVYRIVTYLLERMNKQLEARFDLDSATQPRTSTVLADPSRNQIRCF